MNGYFDSEDDTPPTGTGTGDVDQARHHPVHLDGGDPTRMEAATVSALLTVAEALNSLAEAITRTTTNRTDWSVQGRRLTHGQ